MTEETQTDMNELFNRDPLELSDQDVDKIIAYMRERRALFNAAPAAGKKKPASSNLTEGQQAAMKLDLNLSLDI